MKKQIYDFLQKIFTVTNAVTFILGFILLAVQLFALLTLNGAMAAAVYDILIDPMCIFAAFTAICGALRPYLKEKDKGKS